MKKRVAYFLFLLISISVSFVSNAQKDTMLASAIMKKLPPQLQSRESRYPNEKLQAAAKGMNIFKHPLNRINCLTPDKPGTDKKYIWCNSSLVKIRNRMSYMINGQ